MNENASSSNNDYAVVARHFCYADAINPPRDEAVVIFPSKDEAHAWIAGANYHPGGPSTADWEEVSGSKEYAPSVYEVCEVHVSGLDTLYEAIDAAGVEDAAYERAVAWDDSEPLENERFSPEDAIFIAWLEDEDGADHAAEVISDTSPYELVAGPDGWCLLIRK